MVYFVYVYIADDELRPKYEHVDPFNRIADAGLINVKNPKSPAEMRTLYPYPPAKVKDLTFTETSYENIDRTIVSQSSKREGLYDMELH